MKSESYFLISLFLLSLRQLLQFFNSNSPVRLTAVHEMCHVFDRKNILRVNAAHFSFVKFL